MSPEPWIGDEPRLVPFARHVVRRALRRPLLVLCCAAALAALVLSQRLRRAPQYIATAVIRISEVVRAAEGASPPGALRDYIATRALTRQRLTEIMIRYKLGDPEMAQALENFEDQISIQVATNYFANDFEFDDGPRWAMITIEFAAGDPDRARGVVHDIAAAVAAEQEAAEHQRLDEAHALYAEARHLTRQRMEDLDRESDRLMRRLSVEKGVAGPLANLKLMKASLVDRLNALTLGEQDVQLAESAEDSGVGVTFDLVEEAIDVFGGALSTAEIIWRGGSLFVAFFMLCLIVVGSFDSRIYDAADVAHVRLALAGQIVSFSGDTVQARHDRRRDKRV